MDIKQENQPLETKNEDKVSRLSMVSYGIGCAGEGLMANIIYALALPIYNLGLGIDAKIIGIAIAVPRIWDAITDPVMGNISDNTHSRWGRRKPYVLLGALLTGLFCALLWIPPTSSGNNILITYFILIAMLYFIGYTIFNIPYQALGYELSEDYDERTKVMSYKTFIGSTASILLMQWAYKLCFKFGENEVEGVRVVGVIYGIMIIAFGIAPVFFCKERLYHQNPNKIGFFSAAKFTLKNKPFLMVTGMVLLTIVSFFIAYPLQLYINLSYVMPGEREQAATMGVWMSYIYGFAGMVAVPVINYFARKYDKMIVMIASLILMLAGSLTSWLTFNPAFPYLQLLYGIMVAPALSAMWVVSASCISDLCDVDELNTGFRREGMYGAVFAFIRKLCMALVVAASGYIISFSGFDRDISIQTETTANILRGFHAFGPTLLIVIAIILCIKYPIKRQDISEIKKQLELKNNGDSE